MESIATEHQHNELDYFRFLSCIGEGFADKERYSKSLFTTDATGLFGAFLAGLPEEARQHYNCNACYKFVDTFGGLVIITPEGTLNPIMWPSDVPLFYLKSIIAVRNRLFSAKVTGVFFSSASKWGTPVTGDWHHMAVVPNGVIFDDPLQTPYQAMAAKREDYKTLLNGLGEFPLEAVDQSVRVLNSDALYRSEKVLGVAKWFRGVHHLRENENNRTRNNLTWLAVATAPAGFCHIKSTMIGTLLEDIVRGLSFDAISRRFADKMHPLQYQRPQVAPSAGNIAQAEKTIEKLKAAGSLERRFARLDELDLTWWPAPEQQKPPDIGGGVFSHIKPKGSAPISPLDIPPVTMTWRKFDETVLDTAERIEFYVPAGWSPYIALVTAANLDAPPILQWDTEECRNPVSWYLYNNGSSPRNWGLTSGTYHHVTGICFKPTMWNDAPSPHHSQGVIFILDGARDAKKKAGKGLALFPETLKSAYHGIRKTIEAFSNSAFLQGADEASACGISLTKGEDWNFTFRVFADGAKTDYKLDRWD